MKVVILAGGFGTRISEESHLKPKPMIEIGEKPILWHIMKMYSAYGFNEFDGVADVNIRELLEYHRSHGKMATITAAQPGGRFGILDIQNDGTITNFKEKKKEDGGWINAGFMVLEPSIIDLIEGDQTVFEKEPLVEAARMGQLNAYRHKGFWQCMDTLREKNLLEALWQSGQAPWKIWE